MQPVLWGRFLHEEGQTRSGQLGWLQSPTAGRRMLGALMGNRGPSGTASPAFCASDLPLHAIYTVRCKAALI